MSLRESSQDHTPSRDLAGFPSRDWESATDTSLLGAVRDLRRLFDERAEVFFRRLREKVHERLRLVSDKERPLHLMDLFPATFADLQNVLSRDSGRYFDEFLGIAVGNASLLKFDSVVWAHGQMHAMIGDFLDPKNGYQKLATVREWIKDYCDGPVTMDESAFSSPQQFERALLRSDWRAPTWLQAYPCSRSSSNSEASVALEMTSQEETEKVLKVLAERFWMQIEYHLAHRARLARIGLAKQGALRPTAVPSDTPPCKKNIKTLSPFRELAGRLMHDARSKEPDRFRDETWIEICSKLDAAAFKPLIKYLEGKARDQLANWNQKHSNRPLRTFTEGIRPPAGAMFVRRGIQRTLYRTQEKWEE